MKNSPKRPLTLSPEAKTLSRRLLKEHDIRDVGGQAILKTGLEAFDRMRLVQAQIALDGVSTKDRWGQVKAHPLLSVERDARAQFLAALKQLNLDLEPVHDRPGRPGGL